MWILSTRDALAEVVGSVEQPVALLPQGDRFDELDWLLWAFDRVSPGVAAGFAPLGVSRDGRSILYEVPPEVASALAHERHADMRELAAAWTQDEEWLARAWSWWRNLRELCVRARDTGRQVFGMGGPAGGHTSPPTAESFVEWYASFDGFYRGLDLLEDGLRFSQADLAFVSERFEHLEETRGQLQIAHLMAIARAYRESNCLARTELEVLAEASGARVFRWDVFERIDDGFLDYLSRCSRGAFLPDEREFDSELAGDDEYVFLRLRDRERSARIWLGAARGNDYDSCLHDLNRFIAGSGRQFVMACDGWGYFACLTPEERALLHERGVRFSGLPASDPSLAPPVKSGR